MTPIPPGDNDKTSTDKKAGIPPKKRTHTKNPTVYKLHYLACLKVVTENTDFPQVFLAQIMVLVIQFHSKVTTKNCNFYIVGIES